MLARSGNYAEAVVFFSQALAESDSQPRLLLEFAKIAVLAAQTDEASRHRSEAGAALEALSARDGDIDPREIGELWRRLGWEMVRHSDSLQAFRCFDQALEYGMRDLFETEWLFRGSYAASHLELLSGVTDSLSGTPEGDSILDLTARSFLVELDRIPRTRTDLRKDVLRAKAALLPHTDLREDELAVLTELDRLGGMEPDMRLRRIDLLLETAGADLEAGRIVQAREKLLEVWDSSFSGKRITAAYMLGLMEEGRGDAERALSWYRKACSVSPASRSRSALAAAAKRDSLEYGTGGSDGSDDAVRF